MMGGNDRDRAGTTDETNITTSDTPSHPSTLSHPPFLMTSKTKTKKKIKTVFATVGTTRFDALVSQLATPPVLAALASLGTSQLTIQHGSSPYLKPPIDETETPSELRVISYDYKPDISKDMATADLVISHAGSGSILEALRAKKKLLVVVNETLADNHQAELAEELAGQGFLYWCLAQNLERTLKEKEWDALKEFGQGDASAFVDILDEEMFGGR